MQSYDITLTDTNAHNLDTLIHAANALKTTPCTDIDLITEYREMVWKADSLNGAAVLYIGDASISPTDFATDLGAGSSDTKRAPLMSQRFFSKSIYVRASAQPCRFHLDCTV